VKSSFLTACALSLAVLGAPSAFADQHQLLSGDVADRAIAELEPGALFVDWISHQGGKATVYVVQQRHVTEDPGTGKCEVKVAATAIAALSVSSLGVVTYQPLRGHPLDGPGYEMDQNGRATRSIDLAYVYVASSEIAGMFINLGRKLELQVVQGSQLAVDVPAEVLRAAVVVRNGGRSDGFNDALGEDAPARTTLRPGE
jgi:hypothetical protein